MVKGLKASAAGILLALAAGTGAFAADVLAFPQWSSDQVRAARPTAATGALVFDLQIREQRASMPDTVTTNTVTFAPSYTLVASGAAQRLHDHQLCRDLAWTKGARDFQNTSCFAMVAFRGAEIRNRQVLAQMLAKIGVKDLPVAQPYWDESELGVQVSPNDPLIRRTVSGGEEYRLDETVVVRIVGEAGAVNHDEMKRFVRFLAIEQHAHPQVRRDLGQRVSLPQRLESADQLLGKKVTVTLAISNVRRESVAYPLPAGLTSELRREAVTGQTPMDRGLQAALLAIDGQSRLSKPSEQELVASMRKAVVAHKPLDVPFLFMNLTQQYGGELMGGDGTLLTQVRPLIQAILAAPEAQAFSAANTLAGDSTSVGDRQATAKYLSAMKTDAVPFGTFRYVTFANLVRASGDTSKWDRGIFKAMPAPIVDGYWVHIAAYPWASNAYNDAGGAYFADFDPVNAWIAYDVGRAVQQDWRTTAMVGVSDFEDRLKASEPDFF